MGAANVRGVVANAPAGRPHWRVLGELAGLDERALRASCSPKRFDRGEVVFHEGDAAGALYLIDRGRVAVRLTTPLGEVATLDLLQTGDTFGEQALVDEAGERTATVTAIEQTETLALDRVSFERVRREHPCVDRFLVMVLSARLQLTSHLLLDALYLPAELRVMRCVVRMHAMFSSGSGGVIPLTQADIASMAGVTRSTANRLLNHAQADGVLRVGRGTLEVVDVERLRRQTGEMGTPG
jgi:CRP/FNR family cyclic AMP-dependent transcriptional regulator